MIISIIVAMDENRVIGNKGELPWGKLPADRRNFREITLRKVVVMGRKTFESLKEPLPDRINIVITRSIDLFGTNGWIFVPSKKEALSTVEALMHRDKQEIMVIGGGEIYKLFLPDAKRIYTTTVHSRFRGDTYFPRIDPGEWTDIWSVYRGPDPENPWPLTFAKFERKRQK